MSEPAAYSASERPPITVDRVPTLPARRPESHKGNFGRVLIVAGSRGMSGAACLAGVAALRGGAGLVRVATPQGVIASVAAYEPSYLTYALPEDSEGRLAAAATPELIDLVKANDVVALGPGLGQSREISQTLQSVLAASRGPIVLDADGLNALAGRPALLDPVGPRAVVTPHPGEFARLIGTNTTSVQANRVDAAVAFARRHHVVTVLKGHGTLVTDGAKLFRNSTGNPGMATGGTGDVLTGVVAALLAQGLATFDAATLGVYVHGLAGDLAARELGQTAIIASDLLRFLPSALRSVEQIR